MTPYKPTNVRCAAATLPASLKRVAVLPLSADPTDPAAAAGAEFLKPVLLSELGKAKTFELVMISPEQLRGWAGQGTLSSLDSLPAGLLDSIREATAADAVLFPRLTVYRPYPPLAVGLSFRLVDTRSQLIWWSVDEVFDAGSKPVAKAAESYAAGQMENPRAASETATILISPGRFAQYAMESCVMTLPNR